MEDGGFLVGEPEMRRDRGVPGLPPPHIFYAKGDNWYQCRLCARSEAARQSSSAMPICETCFQVLRGLAALEKALLRGAQLVRLSVRFPKASLVQSHCVILTTATRYLRCDYWATCNRSRLSHSISAYHVNISGYPTPESCGRIYADEVR